MTFFVGNCQFHAIWRVGRYLFFGIAQMCNFLIIISELQFFFFQYCCLTLTPVWMLHGSVRVERYTLQLNVTYRAVELMKDSIENIFHPQNNKKEWLAFVTNLCFKVFHAEHQNTCVLE